MEGRGCRATEPQKGKVKRMPSFETTSTKQKRIADLAKEAPDMAFTSLAHHIDIDWLKEANRLTRKDGAPGVDGRTGREYEEGLETRLQDLLDRAKSGRYRAPPVRRVHIPKGDGKTRPLGIPTYEDKVLQRAVVMALEQVYEQDFHDCSYGFRPGRSAHQALSCLREGLMKMGGGWVIDADIENYFGSIDHSRLREILSKRVRDGVLVRLIGKWLNAGVMESGQIRRPGTGTPQGGVISPLLANVFLHEVLDEWFETQVKPRMKNKSFMVRYADDFVLVFKSEQDARRVLDVLGKRFSKYGLTLHPEKTRLLHFKRPAGSGNGKGLQDRSFDLLGFTLHWARSRKGNWVIRQKTASKRLARALRREGRWCLKNRHLRLGDQHTMLSRKVRGHYAYYGVTGNSRSLKQYLRGVERAWKRALGRRSQRAKMTWERFRALLRIFPLPPPRIVHSVYSLGVNP